MRSLRVSSLRTLLYIGIIFSVACSTPHSSQRVTDRQVSGAHHSGPDALWTLVHEQCVLDQLSKGDPSPCEVVNLTPSESEGFAVLKDQRGDTHFLLIPTAKITGLEDPALLKPETRNFWAAAWRERSRVSTRLGKPLGRGDIGLAVNSVEQENLDALDPFKILAAFVGPENMGDHALALLGETFSDGTLGFYLLDGDSSGEIVLDRECDLANPELKRAPYTQSQRNPILLLSTLEDRVQSMEHQVVIDF